jgi:RHS repeat-associated protein
MGYRIEYDEIYNRTSMTRDWMAVKLPAAFTNDPVYNAANRLEEFNGANIDHDLNGNMTDWGSTDYTWDEFNRLTAVNGTSLDSSYKYDAGGRRIEKTINGTTTKYLYDGADIVLEMNGSDVATAYYIRTLNIDEPLARVELDSGGNVTGIRFYLADALGSIIALTDENGDIKTRYNYTPFGEPEVIGESSGNPFMFAAREYDSETGLLHERHRDYSPILGRYISEDPIGFAGGDINFYVRVGNNPVNFTDPWGLYGTNDCSYYEKRCKEAGGDYYCKTAPFFCDEVFDKYPDPDPSRDDDFEGWTRCTRQCLQDCDRLLSEDDSCLKPDPSTDSFLDSQHSYCHAICYTACGVGKAKHPNIP